MSKIKPPSNYQLIETQDGSITFFSPYFSENCHSTSGAASETRIHYIEGCSIEQTLKEKAEIRILEIGFGTGLGFIETWKFLKFEKKIPGKIYFVSVEIDDALIDSFIENEKNNPILSHFFSKITKDNQVFEISDEDTTLTVLIGDANETLRSKHPALLSFDAIYQDAFSVKKNPHLWTYQWFNLLKNLSHPNTQLSTYSSSVSIRKSMLKAGWFLTQGAAFGTKRSSTKASLTGPHHLEIIEQLDRSPITALDQNDLPIFKFKKME